MTHNYLRETKISSGSQDIISMLRKPKASNMHNSLQRVPVISQINPVQAFHLISMRKILILFLDIELDLSRGLSPRTLPTKTLYASFSSTVRATGKFQLMLCYRNW